MKKETKYPSQAAERFQIRLPDGLRDRIRDAAAENNRSMNAEIVATLEEKYPTEEQEITLSDLLYLEGEILNTKDDKKIQELIFNFNKRLSLSENNASVRVAEIDGKLKIVVDNEGDSTWGQPQSRRRNPPTLP